MHQLRVFGSFWFANGSFSILFKGHPLSCQLQEVEGLLFNPSEPRGRRYVKNMIYNRNRLATGSYALALGRDTKTLSWKEVEGLLFSPPNLSVGAYFELSFLGCGFLIHLSNRYDSPWFRAPWKKIRQKYGTRQELSLFKGYPFSCQYGDALCSMVPS